MIPPLPDFEDITYLRDGSPLQQRGYQLITLSKILYHLRFFRPIVTGTLPLDLFIEGKSDVDIVCNSRPGASVEKILLNEFGSHPAFEMLVKPVRGLQSLICRFMYEEFPFEIFCQPVPSVEQLAYRHMRVEYYLLEINDRSFRDRILELKKNGMKTEPAFASVLGLDGDPFEVLLTLEKELMI